MAETAKNEKAETKSTARTIREYAESLAIAFVLAMIIRHYVVEAFKIPTGSMEPTLIGDPDEGDKILVSKFMYDVSKPERWDVFVFKYPDDVEKNYIKRLVGLPGETLRIKHGDLYVNGQIARKPQKVQNGLWRLVFDERMAVSHHMLRELNEFGDELQKEGLPALSAFEKANDNYDYADWREKVRGREVEAQLRCVEDRVDRESLWRKCSSYARKRLKRKAADIAGARGARVFKRWLGVYHDARASVDAALQDEADKMLADPALLRTALECDWKTDQPGVDVKDDGRVVMDASANTLGAVRVPYRHRIADGRYSTSVDRISRRKIDLPWRNGMTKGPFTVGDVRLVADVDLLAESSEVVLEIREDRMYYRCRLKRSGSDIACTLEAFGQPAGEGIRVPYEGKTVRVDFANVDDTLLLSVNGKFRDKFEFEVNANDTTRTAEAAFVCTAGKVAVDNIELYRDLYYIKDDEMGKNKNGVATLGDSEYYAFGDNSPSSNDSRNWGVVRRENLVGEAFMVIWPLWRIHIIR